jgi:hypothetical protein
MIVQLPRSFSNTLIDMADAVQAFVNERWDSSILPKLIEYVAIPNVSPIFDAQWETNGLLDRECSRLRHVPMHPDARPSPLSMQRL